MTIDAEAVYGSRFCWRLNGHGTGQGLVFNIAQLLVDHPEEVSVNTIEGEGNVMFELTVSKGDFGKIVGKQGRNADAIRTILNAIAGKTRKRLKLEIVE